MKIRDGIQRWTRREEVALRQQFHGKAISQRFRGLRRSERNEAKLFLVAMTPVIVTAPFSGKWIDASTFAKCIMLFTGIWMIGAIFVGGFLLFRSIYRSSQKRDN